MEAQRNQKTQRRVSIGQANHKFVELERQLLEFFTQRQHRTDSPTDTDPEKGDAADEAFNLRDYLMSVNAAQDDAGIISHHKRVGVTWNDLEVIVPGGGDYKIYVRTFRNAVVDFILSPLLLTQRLYRTLRTDKTEIFETNILHKSNGVLKPGEMCLVLGCPGAGCTPFLKAISNQRQGFKRISGDVRYAGIDASEMAKLYKGEVVYNQENDVHIPTLTVAQTLGFALSTKTPDKRLPGVSRREFNEKILESFLGMFNIRDAEHVLLGDAFVRGVSGGERKRVSIAEMMATRAHVTCWDNSTSGLDASTALDYVKSLRIITDLCHQTTFVSLYQAGESIYRLFDKVLVLNNGRQVYFGPATKAREYFISLGYKDLPRQTTADYLTGCTDPNERQFASGQSAATVPSTPATLENVWRASNLFQVLENDRKSYERYIETDKHDQVAFRAAVLNDKKKGVSQKSPYTLGLSAQIRSLVLRQLQFRMQDRFQLYTSFATSIGLAIVLGAAFYNLPPNANGAFTRGSVIFFSLFLTSLDALAEMPIQLMGRPVMHKHTNFGFYRPGAIAISNMLADLPFSAVRLLIFDIIIYFMCHLARSAGGFFTFHLFQYLTFLAVQSIFRLLGMLSPNFDTAFRWATVFVPNMICYSGYIIPPSHMKRWLFWIYYLNPLSYGMGGMMDNEFMRVDISCDGDYVVPRNGPGDSKYPTELGPNQACTLFGATLGSPIVEGTRYIEAGYHLDAKNIWRMELVVLLGFIVIFQILQVLVLEYYKHAVGGGGMYVFVRENADIKERNTALRARKEAAAVNKGDEKLERNISSGKVFTWENLNYHVPVPGGQRRLLHDVFGYIKPGSLTALIGASGAGKTTCLDVLAQRKNIGVVTGDILVDGRPLGANFARGTAYAEQMDVHEGTATVREAMRFSANLRQPFTVPQLEKENYVEEVIELLELQDLADALVKTLGMEARKRLTIGVELAAKPELLLFLDEPTSGLDGQSAWNLVRFLRKLADNGQAILCTIHQPSSFLLESFDRLLLLETGGETVYFGDIGHDSTIVRDYFARHGAVCPEDANPAEYVLEAIGAGVSPRIGPRDWKYIWSESPENARLKDEIREIKSAALAQPTQANNGLEKSYATPFVYQIEVVVKRGFTALWRSPDYIWTRLLIHLFISLSTSLSLLQLGHSTRDLQYRVFGVFFATVMPAIVMLQIEPTFLMNRMVFIREASSGIYSPYVFAISQLLSEIPYSILCAAVYWVLMFWPMGFGQGRQGTNGSGYQLLMCIFLELFGVSLGQLIASVSPNIQIAVLFNSPVALILTTFAGVTIPYRLLAKFWKSWLYELSPYTRVVSGMLATELTGLRIFCKPDEFAVFNPPSGQSCLDWASDFVSAFGGYLDNPDAIEACRYCQYEDGDRFLAAQHIRVDTRWRDLFIVFSFFVGNSILTIIASRFLRYAKR